MADQSELLQIMAADWIDDTCIEKRQTRRNEFNFVHVLIYLLPLYSYSIFQKHCIPRV